MDNQTDSKKVTQTPGQVINLMKPGVFATLMKIKPVGALQARRQSSGAVGLYWRYSVGATSERVPIGLYDPSAPPRSLSPTERGYSVPAAVHAAEKLAIEHQANIATGGRPAIKVAKKAADLAEQQAKAEAGRHTLEALLNDYCDYLEALGRRSHKDARSIFRLHVIEPWPEVAATPAREVTMEQIADMMRRTLELGKGRTSNKLRSYIRAAYQTAKAARSKASIPLRFKAYNITSNPAADTSPDESANKPDKSPLSPDEMRIYWQCIKDMVGFKGEVLRLHLLTGGQRIQQLVNLKTSDVGPDSITLLDGKGRPGAAPRPHTIPLTTHAAKALRGCDPLEEFALSTTGGKSPLSATTLSAWAADAVGDAIPNFQAKRIRSGVETMLAGARVSTEIRGRLQSHGIAGVQSRHYDGHDYMAEKLDALKRLYQTLQPPKASKVVKIRA